jgi:hypothetical protein
MDIDIRPLLEGDRIFPLNTNSLKQSFFFSSIFHKLILNSVHRFIHCVISHEHFQSSLHGEKEKAVFFSLVQYFINWYRMVFTDLYTALFRKGNSELTTWCGFPLCWRPWDDLRMTLIIIVFWGGDVVSNNHILFTLPLYSVRTIPLCGNFSKLLDFSKSFISLA